MVPLDRILILAILCAKLALLGGLPITNETQRDVLRKLYHKLRLDVQDFGVALNFSEASVEAGGQWSFGGLVDSIMGRSGGGDEQHKKDAEAKGHVSATINDIIKNLNVVRDIVAGSNCSDAAHMAKGLHHIPTLDEESASATPKPEGVENSQTTPKGIKGFWAQLDLLKGKSTQSSSEKSVTEGVAVENAEQLEVQIEENAGEEHEHRGTDEVVTELTSEKSSTEGEVTTGFIDYNSFFQSLNKAIEATTTSDESTTVPEMEEIRIQTESTEAATDVPLFDSDGAKMKFKDAANAIKNIQRGFFGVPTEDKVEDDGGSRQKGSGEDASGSAAINQLEGEPSGGGERKEGTESSAGRANGNAQVDESAAGVENESAPPGTSAESERDASDNNDSKRASSNIPTTIVSGTDQTPHEDDKDKSNEDQEISHIVDYTDENSNDDQEKIAPVSTIDPMSSQEVTGTKLSVPAAPDDSSPTEESLVEKSEETVRLDLLPTIKEEDESAKESSEAAGEHNKSSKEDAHGAQDTKQSGEQVADNADLSHSTTETPAHSAEGDDSLEATDVGKILEQVSATPYGDLETTIVHPEDESSKQTESDLEGERKNSQEEDGDKGETPAPAVDVTGKVVSASSDEQLETSAAPDTNEVAAETNEDLAPTAQTAEDKDDEDTSDTNEPLDGEITPTTVVEAVEDKEIVILVDPTDDASVAPTSQEKGNKDDANEELESNAGLLEEAAAGALDMINNIKQTVATESSEAGASDTEGKISSAESTVESMPGLETMPTAETEEISTHQIGDRVSTERNLEHVANEDDEFDQVLTVIEEALGLGEIDSSNGDDVTLTEVGGNGDEDQGGLLDKIQGGISSTWNEATSKFDELVPVGGSKEKTIVTSPTDDDDQISLDDVKKALNASWYESTSALDDLMTPDASSKEGAGSPEASSTSDDHISAMENIKGGISTTWNGAKGVLDGLIPDDKSNEGVQVPEVAAIDDDQSDVLDKIKVGISTTWDEAKGAIGELIPGGSSKEGIKAPEIGIKEEDQSGGLVDKIQVGISTTWDEAKGAVDGLTPDVSSKEAIGVSEIDIKKEDSSSLMDKIKGGISTSWNEAKGALDGLIPDGSQEGTGAPHIDNQDEDQSGLLDKINGGISSTLNEAKGAFDGLIPEAAPDISTQDEDQSGLLDKIKGGISTTWNEAMGAIDGLITDDNSTEEVRAPENSAESNKGSGWLDKIKGGVSSTWDEAKGALDGLTTDDKSKEGTEAPASGSEDESGVLNKIKGGITTAWNEAKGAIDELIPSADSKEGTEAPGVGTKEEDLFDKIKSGISSTWDEAKGAIDELTSGADSKEITKAPEIEEENKSGGLFDKIKGGISSTWDEAKGAVDGLVTDEKSKEATAAPGSEDEEQSGLLEKIKGGITSTWSEAKGSIDGLIPGASSAEKNGVSDDDITAGPTSSKTNQEDPKSTESPTEEENASSKGTHDLGLFQKAVKGIQSAYDETKEVLTSLMENKTVAIEDNSKDGTRLHEVEEIHTDVPGEVAGEKQENQSGGDSESSTDAPVGILDRVTGESTSVFNKIKNYFGGTDKSDEQKSEERPENTEEKSTGDQVLTGIGAAVTNLQEAVGEQIEKIPGATDSTNDGEKVEENSDVPTTKAPKSAEEDKGIFGTVIGGIGSALEKVKNVFEESGENEAVSSESKTASPPLVAAGTSTPESDPADNKVNQGGSDDESGGVLDGIVSGAANVFGKIKHSFEGGHKNDKTSTDATVGYVAHTEEERQRINKYFKSVTDAPKHKSKESAVESYEEVSTEDEEGGSKEKGSSDSIFGSVISKISATVDKGLNETQRVWSGIVGSDQDKKGESAEGDSDHGGAVGQAAGEASAAGGDEKPGVAGAEAAGGSEQPPRVASDVSGADHDLKLPNANVGGADYEYDLKLVEGADDENGEAGKPEDQHTVVHENAVDETENIKYEHNLGSNLISPGSDQVEPSMLSMKQFHDNKGNPEPRVNVTFNAPKERGVYDMYIDRKGRRCSEFTELPLDVEYLREVFVNSGYSNFQLPSLGVNLNELADKAVFFKDLDDNSILCGTLTINHR